MTVATPPVPWPRLAPERSTSSSVLAFCSWTSGSPAPSVMLARPPPILLRMTGAVPQPVWDPRSPCGQVQRLAEFAPLMLAGPVMLLQPTTEASPPAVALNGEIAPTAVVHAVRPEATGLTIA